MKLVDILARELKVWPEDMEAAYSSGHLVRFCTELGTSHVNVLDIGKEPVDQANTLVTRAEWQAAVDALNAPKVVEWDGEGNPPVGIECEWHPNVHGWVKIKILGRDGSDTWYRAAGEEHSQTSRNMAFFRPIRTADQVAAEEREKAIQEICTTLGWRNIRSDGSAQEAAALYDAGYRKEPKPCGS